MAARMGICDQATHQRQIYLFLNLIAQI